MAGRLTQWGAGELVLSYFSRTAEPPASFWLALIREVPPTLYVSGAELDEPENVDYSRVEIPNDYANWSNESQPQVVVNAADVMYTQAVSDWGVFRYWALCNANVEGYNYFVGELEESLSVLTGDTAILGAGDLSISLGPFYLAEED